MLVQCVIWDGRKINGSAEGSAAAENSPTACRETDDFQNRGVVGCPKMHSFRVNSYYLMSIGNSIDSTPFIRDALGGVILLPIPFVYALGVSPSTDPTHDISSALLTRLNDGNYHDRHPCL